MDNDLKKKLEEEYTNKFITAEGFSKDVERLAIDENMNYIEAILHYCDQKNIEVESVPKLLSNPLKDKLKCLATDLNFLKRTSRTSRARLDI